MEGFVLALLLVNTLSGLGQLWLTWYMLRELGDIDKNRTDWWERLEDRWEAAKKLRETVNRIQGRPSPKS